MSSMPMMSPAMMVLMRVAMMVAMMLPSIAPTVWRYHRHLHEMRMGRAGQRTTFFAAGYASVWTGIGLALVAMSAEVWSTGMTSPTDPFFAPWATGVVVLCAGALQRSRWKAKQLLRCRQACVTARAVPGSVMTAWRDGCRLGVDCGLSCAAPMSVLFVAGLMDARAMVVITTAITAERVAPAGARIARLTGVLALITGFVMCVRAIEVTVNLPTNPYRRSHHVASLTAGERGGRSVRQLGRRSTGRCAEHRSPANHETPPIRNSDGESRSDQNSRAAFASSESQRPSKSEPTASTPTHRRDVNARDAPMLLTMSSASRPLAYGCSKSTSAASVAIRGFASPPQTLPI